MYCLRELRKTSYLELINKYKVKKDLLRDNFLEYKNLIKSSLIIITLLIKSITIHNMYEIIFEMLLKSSTDHSQLKALVKKLRIEINSIQDINTYNYQEFLETLIRLVMKRQTHTLIADHTKVELVRGHPINQKL